MKNIQSNKNLHWIVGYLVALVATSVFFLTSNKENWRTKVLLVTAGEHCYVNYEVSFVQEFRTGESRD